MVTISRRKQIWQIKNPEFQVNLENSYLLILTIYIDKQTDRQIDIAIYDTEMILHLQQTQMICGLSCIYTNGKLLYSNVCQNKTHFKQ